MKSIIINQPLSDAVIPSRVMELLPYKASDAIRKALVGERDPICEEIRLRCARVSSLTMSGGRAIPLELTLTRDEMDRTVENLCGGSLYAHGDTIKQGYISLSGGIRVGLCGRAAIDGGKIIGVGEIDSLCIRLPHAIKVNVDLICDILKAFEYSKGVLIYSPPGEGKTTILRSVAAQLSRISNDQRNLRVAVVDTRGELEFGLNYKSITADILSGYPKGIGIEIALRTLNANIIICDEIGNGDEAKSILDGSNGGAALVASAHAYDIDSLMSKKSIRLLHEQSVFGAYVGIKRRGSEYTYTVTEGQAVNL